jgi:HSP20 family protein
MVTNNNLLRQASRVGATLADVDRWFDRVFGVQPAAAAGWSLPVAVWEENDHAYIELELPGVTKENLEITVEQGKLTVAAERKAPETERQYWVCERRYGRFERSFQLPKTFDPDSIEADLSAGVLTLKLSKKPEAQPRKVEIRSN